MARILVLGVQIPFTRGGQEVLVQTLTRELVARGHEADVVQLPLNVTPKEGFLTQAAMWRALDLTSFSGEPIDLVIATKFPSYYARHPRKSLWLVHQHREMYDLFGGRFCGFSDDPRDEELRRMLTEGDTKVIGECAFVSGISKNVLERLRHFNGLAGQVLYPPLPQGTRYRCDAAQDYILSVGRLCAIKRVDLMIQAMPMIHAGVKLRIVGAPDEPKIMEYLRSELKRHDLWDRVEFLGRVSDEELIRLYAGALAVYYAPYNEDYGYVTLEAFASGKPVVTAHDSGGVLEFVTHDENGFIVDPTPAAMSGAFNALIENRERAAALGQRGRTFIETSGMAEAGWDQIITGLLSPLEGA